MFLRETNTSTIFTCISFSLFFLFSFFYGYTSVDQFLLKDCSKSTYFTSFPLKGTTFLGRPSDKVRKKMGENNVMSFYGRAERARDDQ